MTDLWTQRLRDAVEDHPAATSFDVSDYVDAAHRRLRRNRLIAAASTAAAVLVVVGTATLTMGRDEGANRPDQPTTERPSPTATTSAPAVAGPPAVTFVVDAGEGFLAVDDQGRVWRRAASGWVRGSAPADNGALRAAPNGLDAWTYADETADGGENWEPFRNPLAERFPQCLPVTPVVLADTVLVFPAYDFNEQTWCGTPQARPIAGGAWQPRELPPILQGSDPSSGPPAFHRVGNALVVTTDGLGKPYAVSRDGGRTWSEPRELACESGWVTSDPDHTALLGICPGEAATVIHRIPDLTRWERLGEASGEDLRSVVLGADTVLFAHARTGAAQLVTPNGSEPTTLPQGLAPYSAATVGGDIYLSTNTTARNGASAESGPLLVSRDGGRTWEEAR